MPAGSWDDAPGMTADGMTYTVTYRPAAVLRGP